MTMTFYGVICFLFSYNNYFLLNSGCVGAELLLGQPLFPGDSGVDQLVEIIKVCVVFASQQEINLRISDIQSQRRPLHHNTGSRHSNQRRNQRYELQLHRIQISSNQGMPMAKSL